MLNERELREGQIFECYEGAVNNQPDIDSVFATRRIVELAEKLGAEDTLLVLVSGGGSALLCQPREPLDFPTKRNLCRELQNAGADIKQLNTLRRCLSSVKAGGLAAIAHPARVIALILSDIVGDPVEAIASGPTTYVDTGLEIFAKFRFLFYPLFASLKIFLCRKSSQRSHKNLG